MNPTSITLTTLALAGALSSAYFWHQTGSQKADQARVITELKNDNTTLRSDGESMRAMLADAQTRGQALSDTLAKEKQQQQLVTGQLADSRRDNDDLRKQVQAANAQVTELAASSRVLAEEFDSFRQQFSSYITPQQHGALKNQLAASQELATALQKRIEQLTAPILMPATLPPASGGILGTVSPGKNRLVSTKVRQVKGDKVLLGYGARQGAAVNADVRLQDGLDYLGFGRVIYVDENQCLVELNKGHDSIPDDKDIYLLTPEASEKITIRE